MNRWIRTGLLFSALSVTGFIGYQINWNNHNVQQNPHDMSKVFMKVNQDCSLERTVGLFFDNHLPLPMRARRVTDAYFGACVDYASTVTGRMIDERFEREHERIRLTHCQNYNEGLAPENPRYDCDI